MASESPERERIGSRVAAGWRSGKRDAHDRHAAPTAPRACQIRSETYRGSRRTTGPVVLMRRPASSDPLNDV
jgi:hypothetical protein